MWHARPHNIVLSGHTVAYTRLTHRGDEGIALAERVVAADEGRPRQMASDGRSSRELLLLTTQ